MPTPRLSQSGLPRVSGISTAITGDGAARRISLSFAWDPARQARLKAAAPMRWHPAFRVWETGIEHRAAIEAFLHDEAARAGRAAAQRPPADLFAYALAS